MENTYTQRKREREIERMSRRTGERQTHTHTHIFNRLKIGNTPFHQTEKK